MSSTSSIISELYGVEPVRQRRERQGVSGLVILTVLAGIFLFESVHPVMRLQSYPPSDFLKVNASRNATWIGNRNQENIARSYWVLAGSYVAQRYSYGQLLPSRPPEDFAVSTAEDYSTRALYWQRLRGVWNQQDTWVRSYELDTGWINGVLDSFNKLGETARNYLNI